MATLVKIDTPINRTGFLAVGTLVWRGARKRGGCELQAFGPMGDAGGTDPVFAITRAEQLANGEWRYEIKALSDAH